ncbi:ABC transporter ATP-binding protein [Tautonia sociabilis]|uniref:ATP-binding cassette domain-containing protein n=1 Tax=Tautonia sociabilis TaxID=2080755 RepID=A0A432MHA6_9BACT|nr:ATP-binding cassette domain-containing protein [Tautonia sociabilis]RUL86473.1 ATP-binding cassette domain-containing protein [Tautonia sociabilis]
MIEVEHLSKRYGAVRAVEGVSFSVGRGEIVGLLGPNGAGKSTTMKILTTYLMPTSGRARLAGHDVLDEPLAVRRKVGYLPESVPLYPEMRVREFLRFRSRLKDVPGSRRRAAIDDAIQMTGLEDVAHRVVGNLSKGYKQRVGLADALLSDPDILILDEPTAGLDPIQIGEVRELIRELGKRHTILLSTHILPEVEIVCGRVVIIARGRIALDESLEKLKAGQAVEVEVRGPSDAVRGVLETSPGAGGIRKLAVEGAAAGDPGVCAFEVRARDEQAVEELRELIARRVVQNGWALRRLDLSRSSLEERFVRAVRDAVVVDHEGEAA